MKIEVPCKDCVLIAICRNKLFDELIKDCKLLLDALYFDKTTEGGARSKYYGDKIDMIQDILNPDMWQVTIDPKDKFANVISGHTTIVTSMDKTPDPKVIVPKNFKLQKRIKAKSQSSLAKMIRKRRHEKES